MPEALTPPFLLAAGILLLAGGAKLRAPGGAARALWTLGIPSRAIYVRGFAVAEISLGAVCVLRPTRVGALGLASLYLLFAILSFLLARRRASCGCFGDTDGSPASAAQSLLSGALALTAAASALRLPHPLSWVVTRPASIAVVLAVGTLAAGYAAVLVYTQLPRAWGAWSAR